MTSSSSKTRVGPDFHVAVEMEALRRDLNTIKSSLSFRAVQRYWSLRESVLPPGTRRGAAYEVLKAKALQIMARANQAAPAPTPDGKGPREAGIQPWDFPLTRASTSLGYKRIVIVAELSIRSCRTYRVDHKVEMLEARGFEVIVTSWTDFLHSRHALQTAGLLIVYRVPATDLVCALIAEAKRLGIPTCFDIDDLVFDTKAYAEFLMESERPEEQIASLLKGAKLYCEALTLAGSGIASTPVIAEAMRSLVSGPVVIVPNGVDPALLKVAEERQAEPTPKRHGDHVVIGYGSGTDTHDEDLELITPALVEVLKRHPNVKLVLHGPLKIGRALTKLSDRVLHIPMLDSKDYYRAMATWDIALAPLTGQHFNDAKSNIKFLEAAVFGVPIVCSPTEPFRSLIQSGKNGFLAESEQEWVAALEHLIVDRSARVAIGNEARKTALAERSLEQISKTYLSQLPLPATPASKGTRVLAVNVLFAPRTFGGATVVAEQIATRLARRNCEVAIVTGIADTKLPPLSLVRYEALGLPVFGIQLPSVDDPVLNFDNENLAQVFREVVAQFRPDVVHFHSIQQLGAGLLDVCVEEKVPFVVTLHDAWWICQRQFMLNRDNEYCFQEGIDLRTCAQCVDDTKLLYRRDRQLRHALSRAQYMLAPSEFQRGLYEANGFSPARLRVNRNGVDVPRWVAPRRRAPGAAIRFAYLGGRAHHKGYFWLRQIFRKVRGANYVLKLVDIHQRFGSVQLRESEFRIHGQVEVVAPFLPADVDAFYEGVDVLLVPSLWKESFGLAVREALARNIWVITTDGGALHEEVTDGVNGTIVRMGDTDAMVHAIEQVLEGQPNLDAYENPKRRDVRDYDAQAEELLGFLKAAIAQSSGTAEAAENPPKIRSTRNVRTVEVAAASGK